MEMDLPGNIINALWLIHSFENTKDHSQRTEEFKSAIEILTDYALNNPDSKHVIYVKIIKLTYTRKLLEELPELMMLDIYDWSMYVFLLLLTVNFEVKQIIGNNSQLRDNYKRFIGIWNYELINLLKTGSIS
jgi:hypothetical protein